MRAKTKKSLLVLAIVFIICGVFSPPAYSATYVQNCWVPYNISTGEWVTGINITTANTTDVLYIRFFDATSLYGTVNLSMAAHGGRFWTGTVQQLLALAASPLPAFRSPSLILFQSEIDVFTVTQFVMNLGTYGNGFGYQTFHSFPNNNLWPYTTADQP